MNQKEFNNCIVEVYSSIIENYHLYFNRVDCYNWKLEFYENESKNNTYVLLKFRVKKQVFSTFKLTETENFDKQEYAIEINIFLFKLFELLKPHCNNAEFIHLCPECGKFHSSGSVKFSKDYVCDKCIGGNQKELEYDSTVYFFQSELTNLIKIGISKNFRKRKKQIEAMQGGKLNILRLLSGTSRSEKYLHDRFENLRTQGEWFRPEKELLDYIAKTKYIDETQQ